MWEQIKEVGKSGCKKEKERNVKSLTSSTGYIRSPGIYDDSDDDDYDDVDNEVTEISLLPLFLLAVGLWQSLYVL